MSKLGFRDTRVFSIEFISNYIKEVYELVIPCFFLQYNYQMTLKEVLFRFRAFRACYIFFLCMLIT